MLGRDIPYFWQRQRGSADMAAGHSGSRKTLESPKTNVRSQRWTAFVANSG